MKGYCKLILQVLYIVKTKKITALIRFLNNDLFLYSPKTYPKTKGFCFQGGIEVGHWPERG